MLNGKDVLLIIGGGIAAYKGLDLIRRLIERGARVRVVLTQAGARFVTPLSLAALSGEPVYQDLFSLTDEIEMGHIRLVREADIVVVAPATADLIAKMAAGLAPDLATAALLACDKPILIAPAMNVQMWQHPATRRNIAQLEADGVQHVGPASGDLACGEEGEGRLAEVDDIIAAITDVLGARPAQVEAGPEAARPRPGPARPLSGSRALVTAGPTFEPIDPVRYIANRSSGKQGYAIAAALAGLGAETTLISGPVALTPPDGVRLVSVESAAEMAAACEAALPVDIAVCAAAVADWRPEPKPDKIKKAKKGDSAATMRLELIENADILAGLAKKRRARPALVIGFAAETRDLLENAREKRLAKGCDWIVANDVSAATGVFGGEMNRVHLITEDGTESWPKASKRDVADRLARRIAEYFQARKRRGKRGAA